MSAQMPTTKMRCEKCGTLNAVTVVDGRGLRALRVRCGLTLREVAKRAGITAAFLSDIERGNRQPSETTCKSLMRALGARLAK